MPRLKSVTDANGTKIYPVTITRGVYDTDKNQRLNVTLANKAENTVMGASGSTHAPGLVPDTPSTAGTAKYLREDGTWRKPPNTNTTYTLSAGTGDNSSKIILTPSSGTANKVTVPYAADAGTVNGKTVAKDVPSDAKFTDTTYESKAAASGGTAVSLVTTGEKATWNGKQNALTFTSTPSSTNKVVTLNDVPSALPANGGNADTVGGFTVGVNVPANAVFTDNNNAVTLTATTTSAVYEVLFSATADNTTRTEGARKTSTLTYNPSTKALLTGGTIDGLTLAKQTTGFKISGGTTSKTLTVGADYTLGAACAKGVTDNSSATAVTSSDTNLITARTLYYAGYTKNAGTVTQVKVGTTAYDPSSGVVSLPAYPTTLPASDVSTWAKEPSKPSYDYSEIGYTVNTTTANGVYTGAITIDGTKPIHVIAITGNVTVTLSNNPPAGHSTHVLFTSTAARTVTINHDSTSRVCPEAANVTLNVVANGYVEVDFLNANSKIYVRGV